MSDTVNAEKSYFGVVCVKCGVPMIFAEDPSGVEVRLVSEGKTNIQLRCAACQHELLYPLEQVQHFSAHAKH